MVSPSKVCKWCLENKELSLFCKDKGMTGGHENRCKECRKKYMLEYRHKNIDKIREHDRKRGNRHSPEYLRSPKYKEISRKSSNKSRGKYKYKNKARRLLRSAVDSGYVKRKPCQKCGKVKSQGHHHDYDKPLDVTWLCSKHHGEEHRRLGEIARLNNRI